VRLNEAKQWWLTRCCSQLFDIFDVHLRLFGEGLKVQFPHLAGLYDAFAVLPGVSEYLASEARNKRPVNNNKNG